MNLLQAPAVSRFRRRQEAISGVKHPAVLRCSLFNLAQAVTQLFFVSYSEKQGCLLQPITEAGVLCSKKETKIPVADFCQGIFYRKNQSFIWVCLDLFFHLDLRS